MLNRFQHHNLAGLLSLGLLATSSLQGDTIISAQFSRDGAASFQGVELDAAAADPAFANSDQWNHLHGDGTVWFFSNLLDSTGADSGANLSFSGYFNGYNAGSNSLPDTYFYTFDAYGSSRSFAIDGLAPNADFTLFLYAFNSANSANDRGEIFTVGSSTFATATGNPSSLDSAHAVDGVITGVTSSTGTINGTWAFDPPNVGEMDWSGFQLDVTSSPTATPEPATFALLGAGLVLAVLRRNR